jgi:hypothetical protein
VTLNEFEEIVLLSLEKAGIQIYEWSINPINLIILLTDHMVFFIILDCYILLFHNNIRNEE